MNKLFIFLISLVLITSVTLKVYASTSTNSGAAKNSNEQNSNQMIEQPIQNQNQVKTQNQGEEQQLQVVTQEQQGDETGKGVNSGLQNANSQNKKQGLSEVGSLVSQQVQKLLGTELAKNGIGDQVREWARVQSQSQTKIQEQLRKLESKSGLSRSLFGPDYSSLNELKKEMEQNQVRIQQLEQIKLKLTSQGDITNVQEMIALMEAENAALQDKINTEESNGGLLGWLVKLFTK